MTVRVALVGDRDVRHLAHQAIPRAVALAAAAVGAHVEAEWLPTERVGDDAALARWDGIWCVPASPYRSMDGALRAIGFARRAPRPFLGTCGGFQHAVVEFAREALGWRDADHAETAAGGGRLVISPLACALVEVGGAVRLRPRSRLAAAYGAADITEGYHCSYGLAPGVRDALDAAGLRATATNADGDVRAVELDAHPFFVATLFQPERAALAGRCPPLVAAFVRAAAHHAATGAVAAAGPTVNRAAAD
jgi:CTP synthase (UTP-ammonia lyase)